MKEETIELPNTFINYLKRLEKEAESTKAFLVNLYDQLDEQSKAKIDAIAGKRLEKYSNMDRDNVKEMMAMYDMTIVQAVENLEKLRIYGV